MKTIIYIFIFWGLALTSLSAQSNDLTLHVSLAYNKVLLGEALSDISRQYDVNFSYSSDYIPLNQQVSCQVKGQALHVALDELFYHTDIVYRMIGDQVVLKINKEKRIGRIEKDLEQQFNPILYEEIAAIQTEQEMASQMPAIPEQLQLENDMMAGINLPQDFDYSAGVGEIKVTETYEYSIPKDFRASFSLVPQVAAKVGGNKDAPDNTSINLICGKTENIEGVEIGTFLNVVSNDVKGVQVSGLVNVVENNMEGIQFGGTVNRVNNDVKGLQAAGLVNSVGGDVGGVDLSETGQPKENMGVQIAGLVNVLDGELDGIQMAGLGNVVGEGAEGVQVAGLFNHNDGGADIQVSALFNKADYVKQTQVGLVNVCDSVGGVSIGLINIVKGGMNSYNRVELSSSMAMDLSAAMKFGSYKFYSQVKLGGEFIGSDKAWALGFGLGTTMKMSPRSLINFEWTTMHINEDGYWTSKLNMLNSFQVSFDYRLKGNTSFFAGPSINILMSERKDVEGNLIGSGITPYAISLDPNGSDAEANKMWVGFTAGFRF